ncbi:MAG: Na/Pi cotransporter family protein, partial [Akkermansiaceae bacterium]|nr:Na/Pi cotransporter family protein [Akkermansiaceae bacterium]
MSTLASTPALDVGAMVTGLGGGIALFLYGIRKMTEALTTVAGTRMKSFLGRVTTNRFTAAGAGAAVTAVLQSSSVTSVLVVGFVTSGLLTLPQSVGVIVGANIGTTFTAQIIAFKVTKYALVMIAAGFLVEVIARRERTKYYGIALMGIGLTFFGMGLMSDSAAPLRTYEPFMDFMQRMTNPLLGIAVGALFTALIQSSAATTGLVIVMASSGLVSLEAGIALIFGANLGTCATAMLASIGRPREAVRAGVVHVLFNLIGVALWAGFIPQFAEAVRVISPSYPEVEEASRLAFESPRQIANAHTLFNFANAAIFIWFITPMAWLARRIVPDARAAPEDPGRPRYLDPFYLAQPDVALDRARLEITRLGNHVLGMADRSFHAALEGLPGELPPLRNAEHQADTLHAEIITYLGQLSLAELVDPQPRRIYEYIAAANYLENASDVIGASLLRIGRKRLAAQVRVSPGTREVLAPLHRAAVETGRK